MTLGIEKWQPSTGIAGGVPCPYCKRKLQMGDIDAHRCERKIISLSIGKAQLKRIDQLADAAGMSRSEYMTVSALAGRLTPEEMRLLELVRGMKR